MQNWQRAWDLQEHTNVIYDYISKVGGNRFPLPKRKIAEARIIRLRSGHHCLNTHLYKLKLVDSPNCECGESLHTVHHVIMECLFYSDERKVLFEETENIYAKHSTPYWERTRNLETFLWPVHSNYDTSKEIVNAFATFLINSNIKI